jgi:hypothetical protein
MIHHSLLQIGGSSFIQNAGSINQRWKSASISGPVSALYELFSIKKAKRNSQSDLLISDVCWPFSNIPRMCDCMSYCLNIDYNRIENHG